MIKLRWLRETWTLCTGNIQPCCCFWSGFHFCLTVQSFMEDVGRQRTTKYISKKFVSKKTQINVELISSASPCWTKVLASFGRCVGVTDPFQMFAKERERTKLLCSSAATETPAASNFLSSTTGKTPAAKSKKKAGRSRKKDAEEQQVCAGRNGGKARGKSGQRRTSEKKDRVAPEQTRPDTPSVQSTQAECKGCFYN